MSYQRRRILRTLYKLYYGFTTLLASIGGLRYKAKGFGHYADVYSNKRKAVLAGLYQKQISNMSTADLKAGHHAETTREFLREFKELDDYLHGRPMQKRIGQKKT